MPSAGFSAWARRTPGLSLGLCTATPLRRTFLKVLMEASQRARATKGQQMEQGCGAQSRRESLCCAGPIQMGHWLGSSMVMFSKRTSAMTPSAPSRNLR